MLSLFYNRLTLLRASFYLSIIISFFPSCIPSSDPGLSASPDSSITLGDNGEYAPTSNGPISSGIESCQVTGKISVTPTVIAFGLSEQDDVQCQTIAVTPCVVFSAEIDDTGDGVNAFTLKGADGNETTNRLTNQTDGVEVCYQRADLGEHTGRVNIVLDNSSSVYAYAIPLTGTTVPHLFVESSLHPTEGQLVCEYSICDYSDYDATAASFTVPFDSDVNYQDLESILISPFTVSISVGDDTQTQTIDRDDTHISGNVHIPNAPAVYPVVFSMATSQGTLSKTVNLVRFTSPQGLIEVRDGSGNQINALAGTPKESDAIQTYAGINITNLPVSGPSVVGADGTVTVTKAMNMKVWVEDENGQIKSYLGEGKWSPIWSRSNTAATLDFYNNFDGYGSSPAFAVKGLCNDNYSDPFYTYCLPLPTTTELERGTNKVKAELCNDYTDQIGSCTTIETSVLVDNDMPIITITSPKENQIYGENSVVKLTGTIENFTPYTYSADDDGNLVKNCVVKLWLNSSITNPFIPLCDSLAITANTDGNYNSGNQGNIRSASFSVTLPIPADETLCGTYATDGSTENVLTCYTNLIQIKAEDDLGHVGIKVVSFQRGDYNKSALSAKNLTTAQLGEIKSSTGTTTGAPFMLDISEETLQDDNIRLVLEKFLNENLDFTMLALAFGPRKDDDGNIAPFATTSNYDDTLQMLHWTGPDQVKALSNYQQGDLSKFFPGEDAQDACGYPITTALITPNLYQYLSPFTASAIPDTNIWPKAICGEDLNCRKIEQGNWNLKNVDLKDDGFVDLTITLEPKEEGEPAFFGYLTAYNLIQDGTTGNLPTLFGKKNEIKSQAGIPDPVLPLWMNFGRITLHLEDTVRIMKAQVGSDGEVDMSCHASSGDVEPCECKDSSNCVNMLYVYYQRLLDLLMNETEMDDTISFEPYKDGCRHFAEQFPNASLPVGCDTAEVDAVNTFFLDTNSKQGQILYLNYGDALVSPKLKLFDQVFKYTLIHTLSCAGNQLVNPIIAPTVFPYPSWTNKDQKVSANLALDNAADGLSVTTLENAENPAFTFSPNLKEADININDGGVQLKLPMSMGATDVTSKSGVMSLFESSAPLALFNLSSGAGSRATTRGTGYMSREADSGDQIALDDMEEISSDNSAPFFGMSLHLEEVLNSATHVLFRKGVEGIVNLIDTDIVKALDIQGSSLTVNKVTLSRDPINLCGGIANPLATTSLSVQTFFNYIKTLFPSDVAATSWTITLDKNSPPTFAVLPLESMHAQGEELVLAPDENAQLLQLGLSNVQISIHGLREHAGASSTYEVLDEVVKIRLDGLLRIVIYYDNERNFKVDLLQGKNSVLYASVINRGGAISEADVVRGLVDEVFPKVLDGTFGSNYVAGGAFDDQGEPQDLISVQLPSSLAEFDNMEVTKRTAGSNDVCENGPYQYKNHNNSLLQSIRESIRETFFPSGPPASSHSKKSAPTKAHRKTVSLSNSHTDPTRADSIHDDPCMALELQIDHDNPITEALCDYGIKNVNFGSPDDEDNEVYPHLVIDSKTGYVHFSTEFGLTLYDSFFTEAN